MVVVKRYDVGSLHKRVRGGYLLGGDFDSKHNQFDFDENICRMSHKRHAEDANCPGFEI